MVGVAAGGGTASAAEHQVGSPSGGYARDVSDATRYIL